MTDDIKARRRETANRIRVKASPSRFTREEFDSRYMEQSVIIGREEIEARCQEMFCDTCAEPHPSGGQLLRTLFVTIDDDPLGNFWKLAHLKCFGCGFDEFVPLDRPNFNEDPIAARVVDVWQKEREDFEKRLEYDRVRQMHAALAAQVQGKVNVQLGIGQGQSIAEQQRRAGVREEYERLVQAAEKLLGRHAPVPQPMLERIRHYTNKLAKKS